MSLKDKLMGGPEELPKITKSKRQHPTGWTPSVVTDGTSGQVCTPPLEQSADEADLIAAMGLDPEEWRIDGKVLTNRWQQHVGSDKWLYQYKFSVVSSSHFHDEGWEDSIKRIAKHKPKKLPKGRSGVSRVFCLADTQAGKGEGGGSEALADRVANFIDQAVDIVKTEKPECVYLFGMGDIVEQCSGNYPGQQYMVDMDQRQQERFARRMILSFIEAVSPHTPRMVLTTTPSNHGENRQGGKAITGLGDNRDMAIFEAVQEACEHAPAYSHVKFHIPDDEVATVLDISGTIVAVTHGHYFGTGATPQQKAINWWKGQAAGRLPAGDADILISAHYHHPAFTETHGRHWFQCPSLDGGSKWFTDKTGEHSRPGVLTLSIDKHGLRDFSIIRVD